MVTRGSSAWARANSRTHNAGLMRVWATTIEPTWPLIYNSIYTSNKSRAKLVYFPPRRDMALPCSSKMAAMTRWKPIPSFYRFRPLNDISYSILVQFNIGIKTLICPVSRLG